MGTAKLSRQAMGSTCGQPPAWALHYTLGRKIPRIPRDGAIRDEWMDRNRERYGSQAPYSVWLTTAETVELTSTAALTFRGPYATAPDLFKELTGGNWRIGLPADHPLLLSESEGEP